MKASPYLNDEPFCFNQKPPSFWVNQGLHTSVGGGKPSRGSTGFREWEAAKDCSNPTTEPDLHMHQDQHQDYLPAEAPPQNLLSPSYKIKTSPHPPGTPPCAVFRCKNQSLNQQGSIQRQWWEGVAFKKELMHLWAKIHCRTLLSSAVFIAVKSGER